MSGKASHIRLILDLPKRQREVLTLLASGETTESIAETLHVARKTVEFHRRELMILTHLFSYQELTRLAVRLGVADINP